MLETETGLSGIIYILLLVILICIPFLVKISYNQRLFLYLCPLWVLLILELWFFCYTKLYLIPKLNSMRVEPPSVDNTLYDRFMTNWQRISQLNHYSIQECVEQYFQKMPLEEIKRDNFKDFFGHTVFEKPYTKLTEEELEIVEKHINHLEALLGRNIEKGYNPEAKHLLSIIQHPTYRVYHRPLILYWLNNLGVMADYGVMTHYYGFERMYYNKTNLYYWYRPAIQNDGENAETIVLYHGIVSSMFIYYNIFARFPDKNVVVIDLEHIKMNSFVFSGPSEEEFAQATYDILQHHNIERITLVGQSFGSFMVKWFLQRYQYMVNKLVLLDPVAIMLVIYPEVAYNFLASSPKEWYSYVVQYFVWTELTVAHNMHRQFWWYKNILYLEDIHLNIPVLIGMAEHDCYMNTKGLYELLMNYKESYDVEQWTIVYWKDAFHNDSVYHEKRFGDVAKWIEST